MLHYYEPAAPLSEWCHQPEACSPAGREDEFRLPTCRPIALIFLAGLALFPAGAVHAQDDPTLGPLTRTQAYERAAALAALGRMLFNDVSLSGSGQMACATCHDPAHAFGPAGAEPVHDGGKDMQQPGLRAVPSLRYLQAV